MEYEVVIPGRFSSLNEFILANRTGKGNWNKGNKMKQSDQLRICSYIAEQLHRIHIDSPVELHYRFYEPNKKRDLDNISGYFHKIFQDALVECGTIHNDSWMYIVGFEDSFYVDNKNPRIEITIKEVQNGRIQN